MNRIGYVIYKLTFPNGKIYIGKDIGGSGHSLRYFGSWDNDLVIQDFNDSELRDFTLRKEIIFESTDRGEISQKEVEFILLHESNNPNIGYNKLPKFRQP